jgi:hypothetical protein
MGFTQICKQDETTYVSVGNRKICIPGQLSNYVAQALILDVIIRMEIFHSDYFDDVNIQVREIPNTELTNKLDLINIYIDTIRLCENSLKDFCSGREDSMMLWTKDHTDKLEMFLTKISDIVI